MKIAIAKDDFNVSSHFGHCQGFQVYDLEGNQITLSRFVENPGHQPGALPRFLKELDTNVIICGGMGLKAQQLFKENSINVIVGASGPTDEVINTYISGHLCSTGNVCKEHTHSSDCGGHE